MDNLTQYRKYHVEFFLRYIQLTGKKGLSLYMTAQQVDDHRHHLRDELLSFFTKHHPLTVPVTVSLFDPTERIKANLQEQLQKACEEALRERDKLLEQEFLAKPMIAFEMPKNAGGKKVKWETMLKKLGESLTAYDKRQAGSSSLYSIASEMELMRGDSENDYESGAREVRRRIMFAEKLITAAGKGTFHAECMKPYPKP